MRVLYDGRIYQMQRAGGINRYFTEVISRLPVECQPLITGVESFGSHIPKNFNLRQLKYNLFRPRRVSHWLEKRCWKPWLLSRVDVFHPTFYDLTRGFSWDDIKCPVVLTVYDFICASCPDLVEGVEHAVRSQTKAIQRADFVICISRATEKDLLTRFPEKTGKTVMIHLGSSFDLQEQLPKRVVYEKPTFLFVGGRNGYKNFFFALRAFARARESDRRIHLRVAGAPFSTEELGQIFSLGMDKYVELFVYPSEHELINLYRSSVALLYPSLHEGFGIPPLEAMACRTMAITSDRTSLPEVVGNAGIMLNPSSQDDWVECILQAATDRCERALFVARGAERVKTFSWKKSVSEHVTLYRKMVGHPKCQDAVAN